MTLTRDQQLLVENNLGLVGKVIKDKVHGLGTNSAFTYDDLFQIGCIGLCKAAATDKGGCFSTYAYRLIWNEICDALIKCTRFSSKELVCEPEEIIRKTRLEMQDPLEACELHQAIADAKAKAEDITAKGIDCLKLSAEGYTSKELSEKYSAKPATVRMWMTKARRYLQTQPEIAQKYYRGAAL